MAMHGKTVAMMALVIVGSRWVPKNYPSRRGPAVKGPREVLEIHDGPQGKRVRLSGASEQSKVTWIEARRLVVQYDPAPKADPAPKPKIRTGLNGSSAREQSALALRAIVREEVEGAIARTLGGRQVETIRGLLRLECLAAIREAFGESAVPS